MIKIENSYANDSLNKEIESKLQEYQDKKREKEIEENIDASAIKELDEKIAKFERLKASLNNEQLTNDTIVIAIPTISGETEYITIDKENFSEFEKTLSETGPDFEYSSTILNAKDIIPELNIKRPRAKTDSETVEEYENMLAEYYQKNCQYVAKKDENGIREPYPHEKYEWIQNKYANKNSSKDYVTDYYKNNILSNKPQTETPDNLTSDENTKPQKRKFAPKKRKVQSKKKWWDFIHSVPAAVKSADETIGKDETWSNIKKGLIRFGKGALIAAAAIGATGITVGVLSSVGVGITMTNFVLPILAGLGTGLVVGTAIKLYKKDNKRWKEERAAQKTSQVETENIEKTQVESKDKNIEKQNNPKQPPAPDNNPATENVNNNKNNINNTNPNIDHAAQEEYLINQLKAVKKQTDAYKMRDQNEKKATEYKNLLIQKKNIIMMMLKIANQEINQNNQAMEAGGMSL